MEGARRTYGNKSQHTCTQDKAMELETHRFDHLCEGAGSEARGLMDQCINVCNILKHKEDEEAHRTDTNMATCMEM